MRALIVGLAMVAMFAPTPAIAEHYHRPGGPPVRSVNFDYIVRHGDTLWSIAATYSGNGRRWRWITDAHGDRVDPYRLHAGEQLAVVMVSAP